MYLKLHTHNSMRATMRITHITIIMSSPLYDLTIIKKSLTFFMFFIPKYTVNCEHFWITVNMLTI